MYENSREGIRIIYPGEGVFSEPDGLRLGKGGDF